MPASTGQSGTNKTNTGGGRQTPKDDKVSPKTSQPTPDHSKRGTEIVEQQPPVTFDQQSNDT